MTVVIKSITYGRIISTTWLFSFEKKKFLAYDSNTLFCDKFNLNTGFDFFTVYVLNDDDNLIGKKLSKNTPQEFFNVKN